MHAALFFHSYRYFPYEKRLALREVAALLDTQTQIEDDYVSVDVPTDKVPLLRRLTYFARAVTEAGETIIPDQAKWEGSSNGWHDFRSGFQLRRQSTRYSLHSLHEYKGRFNPQIVRAVGNLLGLEQGAYVIDPFCGSGTALLESAHIGWNAVGLDLNPLAVLIANAKLGLCRLGLDSFQEYAETMLGEIEELVELVGECHEPFDTALRSHLTEMSTSYWLPSQGYLEQWFPEDVLTQFRVLLYLIEQVPNRITKSALRVCLSNIVRAVSFQEPADLRIRRRKEPQENYPAIQMFWQETRNLIDSLTNTEPLRYLIPEDTHQLALHRDSRSSCAFADAQKASSSKPILFDAAVTSPPYANALPYIDTQRLSLVLLGFIKATEIMPTDRTLIGSREITTNTRHVLESELEANEAKLPQPIHGFLTDLLDRVRESDVGFRRQNRPALLYKYFADMKKMFSAIHRSLRPEAPFALIVGTNRTRLDGEEIVIPTPEFLVDIALSAGFSDAHLEQLDTYQRYDLHRANSIASESLLILSAT